MINTHNTDPEVLIYVYVYRYRYIDIDIDICIHMSVCINMYTPIYV